MRFNFRVGWFRLEVAPKPKVVLDVRRTVAGKTTKPKKSASGVIRSVSGAPKRRNSKK